MADRVVNVKLKVDASDYTSTLMRAAASTKAFGQAVERESRSIERSLGEAGSRGAARLILDVSGRLRNGRGEIVTASEAMTSGMNSVMERRGGESGGILAKGINSGLIRNSPLIAAAVGGALAAGAPVALAGAAMLFGGIGAIAAAQSLEVREAWLALGDEITSGTIEDARVLIPELTAMAGDLGDSFQDIRPQLREAFEATAPLVESFADGVSGLATNSMPGFVSAIQSADPVMEGFQSFLESTGTGISDFFGGLADNAPAAGDSLDALGDIVGELLPLIGEFLGEGAELASVVLPPLATALGAVTDVAGELGPLLPAIVTGFTAMRVAQAASGYMSTFAVQAQYAATAMTNNATAGARVGGALRGVTGLLPLAGAAFVAYTAFSAQGAEATDDMADAIMRGGDQFSTLKAKADAAANMGFWEGFAGRIAFRDIWDENFGPNVAENFEKAEEQVRALEASMSPLELAQLRLDQAQQGVNDAVGEFGAASPQASAALDAYEIASADAEREQAELQLAVDGVTQAMLDQADQAMAAIDSQFAYRGSVNQLEDAQIALKDAVINLTNEDENLRTTQEDVERAQLLVEEQAYRTAVAFGQQQADLSGLDEGHSDYARTIQTETLAELYRLHDAAGPEMKAAIQTQIDALILSGVQLDKTGEKTDTAAGKANGFRDAVNGIPAYKQTNITADTSQATAQIDELMARLRSEGALTISRAATAQNTFRALGGDIGGIVHAYADGGFEPMRGGIAQVVAPNTWRVIGDRVVDDEAYIPINKSQRSQQILEQTAQRMGYGLAPKDLRYFADGGFLADQYEIPVELTSGTAGNLELALSAKYGVAGSGNLGSGVTSMFAAVKRAFPQANLNSGFRAGDPGYHGRGKAIDLGQVGRSGGIGHAYLADMNRWLHDNYGRNLAELIYDGAGDDRPNLKNGRQHAYDASTRAQHRNHVHAATFDRGGIAQGVGLMQKGTIAPERVLSDRQTEAFEHMVTREFSGSSVSTASPTQLSVTSGPVHVYLDGQEWRGMARVEASAVVNGELETLDRERRRK
ncbi:hypothetical protein O2W18_04420 [Modestobacter sp. VKM Ac-2983]|uniref:hypothetical protein n=1 Tax=Modestobacter sp. VKM Ac-2983 TaxID=3004137 RepID=UPI0022AB84B7|nr:hypothetical protein [Modestobacter sp. VKM Ac-2983]MCZ2804338.1 hypothetical protein [Modestobacter sp. VKM Ac-2983]